MRNYKNKHTPQTCTTGNPRTGFSGCKPHWAYKVDLSFQTVWGNLGPICSLYNARLFFLQYRVSNKMLMSKSGINRSVHIYQLNKDQTSEN